jgi:hypothetical protein
MLHLLQKSTRLERYNPYQNTHIKQIYSLSLINRSKYMKIILPQIFVKKCVPLHAMEAQGGRGGIAPTHT